jgi:hypothetical protein
VNGSASRVGGLGIRVWTARHLGGVELDGRLEAIKGNCAEIMIWETNPTVTTATTTTKRTSLVHVDGGW